MRVEVDILEGGCLDLPDATLRRLDLVVAAGHEDFDLPCVVRHAHQRGCFLLALNARPARIDPGVTACLAASAQGVAVNIIADAHGAVDFDPLRLDPGQARRDGLRAAGVRTPAPMPCGLYGHARC